MYTSQNTELPVDKPELRIKEREKGQRRDWGKQSKATPLAALGKYKVQLCAIFLLSVSQLLETAVNFLSCF